MKFILLIVIIIMILTSYFTMRSAIKPRKNILFGVTLPKEVLDNKEILEITREYKKEINIYILIGSILGLATLIISKVSLQIIYLLIWSFAMTGLVVNLPYKKTNKKLKVIKEHNNWYTKNDNDEYWINGYKYYNKNDDKITVSSRYGYSLTYNLANKKGKILNYGGLVLSFIIVTIICTLLLVMDFSKPTINISKESGKVIIDYPIYNYNFFIDDIDTVKLVDNIKLKAKTNGIGTNEYSRGNFRAEEYGKCKVYIYKESQPYIVIKVKNRYVIYNEEDKIETLKVYKEIKSILK